MSTIKINIVSSSEEIYSGEATMVYATGTLGELGIAPGHTPLLTGLAPGPVRVQNGSEEEAFFCSGGFLEVQPNLVTVLSDTAERADSLDESEAIKAKETAEQEFGGVIYCFVRGCRENENAGMYVYAQKADNKTV